MQSITVFLLLLLSSSAFSAVKTANLPLLKASQQALAHDLGLIEKKANLPVGTLKINSIKDGSKHSVKISCSQNSFTLDVVAATGEKASTLYKGIKELGFLFPHPMMQISPTLKDMKKVCGKTFEWRPALRYRGSHYHNIHPNEWVHGFFMNKADIAEASVRWLARNGQNLLDITILRTVEYAELSRQLTKQFQLARSFEIHTGVSIGLAFSQQKSYKLLSLPQAFLGWGAEEAIVTGLEKLFKTIPLSFIFLEAGTSEFTPANYEKTIDWLNLCAQVADRFKAQIFTRAHISTNQHHPTLGNYNFISQYSKPNVGTLPHTVFFYGVLDAKVPMYGNKTFNDLRNFMLREKGKRPTWYYPETSWWLGMDIDVPIFLTDYLYTRAQDYRYLYLQGIEGHVNFTTGQAMGYWLFDWNLALINDLDHDFSPLAAIKLLGESEELWQKHIDFQHEWIKKKGIIAQISSANLQDELSETERIHDRYTMKQLSQNRDQVKSEIKLLEEGLAAWPSIEEIKHPELKSLMEITKLRHQHAIELRKALRHSNQRKIFIERAKTIRREAQAKVEALSQLPTNYPELPLFKEHANPTSYQFGYLFPASSMYWWKREERQVGSGSYSPWNGNMYNVWRILF